MIASISMTLLFLVAASLAPIHAIGLLLSVFVLHGSLVSAFGNLAVHLPLAAATGLLVGALVTRRWTLVSPLILAVFGVLLLVMIASALTGIDFGNSVLALTQYAKGFLLAIMLCGLIKRREDFRVTAGYFSVAITVGAAIALYQHVTGTYSINTEYEQRAAGIRSDPNDTAMLLVAGVPVIYYWVRQAGSLPMRLISLVALLLVLFAVILTESRGGFIALLAVASALIVRRPTLASAIAAIVAISVFIVMAPQSYWERMGTLVTRSEQPGGQSLNNRMLLQLKGLEILAENPIAGVGPGNFGIAFAGPSALQRKRVVGPSEASEERVFAVAHNLHLEFFVETGVVGGLLLWLVFSLAVVGLWNLDPPMGFKTKELGIGFAIALSLMSMLLAGVFLSQGKNSVLWFLVGLGLAAHAMLRRHTASTALSQARPARYRNVLT